MKHWILRISILPVAGMALFPFILIADKKCRSDSILINHERIHLRQQLEMLVIPFYLLYLFNYFINLIRYRNHAKAYYNIAFEKEAYKMDKDLSYLKTRSLWAWIKYLN